MAVLGEDNFQKSNLSDFYASFKQGALDAAGVVLPEGAKKDGVVPPLEAVLNEGLKEKKKKRKEKRGMEKRAVEEETFEHETISDEIKKDVKKNEKKLTEKEIALVKELTPEDASLQETVNKVDVESEEYKNASIDIYRTLLMLGEVPFINGFLVRGKNLGKTGMLDYCINTLVKNGIDIEMRLPFFMAGEDKELKEEIKNRTLDLRAYVLGADKIIEPNAKEWLERIGVDEIRLKSIKESVDEKYSELFAEEEELYQRSKKEIAYGVNSEFADDNKSFYNPVDDLKAAYDLVEDESGFIKLGDLKEDSPDKESAKKRLEENEYNLSIVEDNGIEAKRELAARIAAEINSLLSIYVESWIRSNRVLSQFMSVNAERLKKEKVMEEKKTMELGEASFYNNMFDDLYLSVLQGEAVEKKEAIDRLREHGVRAKNYDRNSEKDRLKYLDVLHKIINDSEDRRMLEWQIIRRHELDSVEDFSKRYLDLIIIDEKVKEPEEKSAVMYPEVFADLWLVENGSEEESKMASERLINNGVKIKTFTEGDVDGEESYRLALKAIKENNFVAWGKKRENAEKFVKKILGLDDSVENKVKIEKKEKIEAETIWDQKLFEELEAGTSGVNKNKEFFEARDKLRKRGINLSEIAKTESEAVQKRLLSAIAVVKSNKPDEKLTVDLARQEIMNYFGLELKINKKEEGKDKNNESFVVGKLEELGRLEKLRGKDQFSRVDQMRVVREMVDAGYSYLERVINEENPDKADKMLADLCLAGRLVADVELRKNYPNQWANTIKFFQILGLKMI